MTSSRHLVAAVVCGWLAIGAAVRLEAAEPCDDLAKLQLPHTAIAGAALVPRGGFTPPAAGRGAASRPEPYANLPAFCRVVLSAQPSADSDIRIEVWLPASGWNGRLQAVGDGGLAGSIPYPLMAPALMDGYAAAGTDTGHVGGTADFMPAHPEKLVDFAYRSTHELAVAAKAIVTSFYGRPAAFAYYNACSGGGRHAITSAQRYPEDFNGIVAGAPSWNQARLDAARIGINLSVNRSAESRIPATKYAMVHRAVLQACDAADGVRDGLIENPPQCRFDYGSLTCNGPDRPDCLTPPQVESARTLTSPFRDPATGRTLLDAHLWPGSELLWGTLGGPDPLANSLARVRNFHLKDPGAVFTLTTIGPAVERAAAQDNHLLASDNFDLRPFFGRGGKLMMWHGWSDPQIPAQNSVIYFNKVRETVGRDTAARSIELFMLPGVAHCGGGEGPDVFDKMTPIVGWVEQGRKPSRLIASKITDGRVERTRPLCPLGQVARYSGSGSLDEAANFACVAESRAEPARR
jgi:feruloyl esterase